MKREPKKTIGTRAELEEDRSLSFKNSAMDRNFSGYEMTAMSAALSRPSMRKKRKERRDQE